ncbi:hypothetical protein GCM10023322_17000 [Rugosimonospora acidiphila]|uniref:Uncharacterized protein n=1 Tax=Rugosimonospora acidiphila TaxID=556531 RepID=A0ABP9RPK1_9ACTN
MAGSFAGATAILVPYHGVGWPDAVWAALFGGSAALTWWRWSDLRELTAQPAPEPPDPIRPGERSWSRVEALVSRLPAGRSAVAELQRVRTRARLHGSSVLPAWTRLDRAAHTFAGLAPRLDGTAQPVALEARSAEHTLRDLGERTAAVERALTVTSDDAELERAHADLLRHFTEGVDAYEKLVGAAAGYVAANGRLSTDGTAVGRMREATDLLRGVAAGLSELRTLG